MTSANYQTVFEIGLKSFAWGTLFHPTIAIVIGLALIRFSRGRGYLQVVGGCGALSGALIFVIAVLRLVPEFIEIRHAYAKGDSSIVQGTVEDFHPMPMLGPSKESFSVNGANFSYYVGDATPCFHNDPLHRGPVHAGLDVRIYYKDGCIQRVDVRRQ
jgi:hypothetical protein